MRSLEKVCETCGHDVTRQVSNEIAASQMRHILKSALVDACGNDQERVKELIAKHHEQLCVRLASGQAAA